MPDQKQLLDVTALNPVIFLLKTALLPWPEVIGMHNFIRNIPVKLRQAAQQSHKKEHYFYSKL